MQNPLPFVALAGLLAAISSAPSSAADLEDPVVGPIAEKTKYVVSPRGVHLATVAPKGSRVSVVVDGVAGPRFDDILETSAGAIDPRPYAKLDGNFQPRGAAVTFSRDGARHAYVGRLGQEWVLMVDHKEMLRLPATGTVGAVSGIAGSEGNTDLRLEFTGESGKHLLLTRSSFAGYELWFDGQKWPGFHGSGGGGSEGTIDPIISPDGERVAYIAQLDREKRGLVVDGKVASYFGTHLQFTPDKRLLCVSQGPKGQAVLIDGKQLFSARQILGVFVPPAGNRLIFSLVHFNKEGNAAEGSFLLVDGKPVEATLTHESTIAKVLFSPDGKRYAAVCGKTGNQFVVVDGKKGQEYFNVQAEDVGTLIAGIAFSPDSSKLAYIATMPGTGSFVVINEEESDALQNPWFRFSADGKHVAYGGGIAQGQKSLLVVDGKPAPLPAGWRVDGFTFSPDGAHHAFHGQQGGNKGIFLDGRNTEVSGDFAFSPDGKHLAVFGSSGKENKSGLFVDGKFVFDTYDKSISHRGFTPDGQHVFWMAREPAIGAKAGPGVWENVIYIDGNPAARCDDIAGAQGSVRSLYGSQIGSLWKMPAALNVTAAGKVNFLGPLDDGIRRFTATPAADTNIDTMIAAASDRRAKPKTAATTITPTGRANAPDAATPPTLPPQASDIARTATTAPGSVAAKPAAPAPATDAATLAKQKVDAAAAKTKTWLEGLTKKK